MISRKIILSGIALIAFLIILVIALAMYASNVKAKQQLSDLENQNQNLVSTINQLTLDEKKAQLAAMQAAQLYAADTIRLTGIRFSYDSLTRTIAYSKILIHAKVTAVTHLNDTATLNLFRANLNRFGKSISN